MRSSGIVGSSVIGILTILACGADPAEPAGARWPRPGLAVVVEARAEVDDDGRARAWDAVAWTGAPAPEAGCHAVPPRDAAGLAAVDVGAPAAARLTPGAAGLRAAGPRVAEDARWQVGDVRVVRDDGFAARFEGALRFPDAPDLGELELRDDGGVWLQWRARAGEVVELEATNAAGVTMRCRDDGGRLLVPWTAYDPAHPEVRVRAVQEARLRVDSAFDVVARAAVELRVSLAHAARWSERVLPAPRLMPASPGPRRAPRGTARRG